MAQPDSVLPPELWSRPRMAAALATCDMAEVIEGVRVARGWSQSETARAVGYSQSWVSRVVNGRQPLTVAQSYDIAQRLGVPLHLLRLDGRVPGEGPAVLGAGRTKGVNLTKRRDFGRTVAAGALVTAAGDRGGSGPGAAVDESTASTLRTITSGQRRMDATSPAHYLLPGAVAHVHLTEQTLANAHGTPWCADLSAAASEVAGFAAWLYTDRGRTEEARGYYRTAVTRARQAHTSLLHVYMLGSLAAFEVDDAGNPELGLALVQEAEHVLGRGAHPTAQAWLSCTAALAHAGVGDRSAAAQAIRRAEREVERSGNTDPPWPWVFAFDPAKVSGVRARVETRLRRPAQACEAFEQARSPRPVSAKQAALLQVETASARVDAGEVEEAFRLAQEALSTGLRFDSRRIVSRVHAFRSAYRGPDARCVREFDRCLRDLAGGGAAG